MDFLWYELDDIIHDKITFVVMIAKYKNELIIIRNRNREVWELPGGRREEGEFIIETASRELYEETGSIIFELSPLGIYAFHDSYGMAFYAEVEEIDELPESEIAEIRLIKSLPEGLNYGEVYYKMYERLDLVRRTNKGLKTYKINYMDRSAKYEF
ncbi:NUDIX hydrolase [Paenibacillus alvei]|uniref:NUDIX hydrolase n=1 Tax=Paenibacillus alvei TaxID=44250 RepID=UPI000385A0AE|nr:NUDIX domain-containing protein [Paenibacillus alvei]EPY11235.1 NUDIX hydrolase [Paenibacillus alvei A6-6i-x]